MIKSLKIKNFKVLRDISINDIRRINLIAGKNNTGKTSLLETVFFYQDRLNPSSSIRIHTLRGLEEFMTTPDELWGPLFYDFDLGKEMLISALYMDSTKSELTIKHNPTYTRQVSKTDINGDNTGITAKNLSKPIHSLDLTIKDNSGEKQEIHNFPEGKGISRESKNLKPLKSKCRFLGIQSRTSKVEAEMLGELIKKGQEEKIIPILKNTMGINIDKLVVIPQLNTVRIEARIDGRKETVPMAYLGGGTNALLRIILSIANLQNGIILIDEIENGFHFSVLDNVWKAIAEASREFNCQVFATTHSHECLVAALNAFKDTPDDLHYIKLDRVNDEIKARELDYELLQTGLNGHIEVR